MEMIRSKALVIKDTDNVATAIQAIRAGEAVSLGIGEHVLAIKVLDDIAFGHKFALVDIAAGAPVVKYGEPIGAAIKDIKTGQYVHVHNVESIRGRGDKQQPKG